MPFTTGQLLREPEYWQDQLPNPDDYPTIEEYLAAVGQGDYTHSPKLGGYYNEGTDEWIGGRQTEAEYAARYANHLMDPSYSKGLGGAPLLLDSMMHTQPDLMAQAYGAWDSEGKPLVNDVVLSLMEQYGFRPDVIGGAVSGGGPGAAPPSSGSGRPGAPDVDTGFIDTGKGYWQDSAGHSAYLNPATGEWTYYVHFPGNGPGEYTPMNGAQYQQFWNNVYGGEGHVPVPVSPGADAGYDGLPAPPASTYDPTGGGGGSMGNSGMMAAPNEDIAGVPADVIQRIRARRRRTGLLPPRMPIDRYGY